MASYNIKRHFSGVNYLRLNYTFEVLQVKKVIQERSNSSLLGVSMVLLITSKIGF